MRVYLKLFIASILLSQVFALETEPKLELEEKAVHVDDSKEHKERHSHKDPEIGKCEKSTEDHEHVKGELRLSPVLDRFGVFKTEKGEEVRLVRANPEEGDGIHPVHWRKIGKHSDNGDWRRAPEDFEDRIGTGMSNEYWRNSGCNIRTGENYLQQRGSYEPYGDFDDDTGFWWRNIARSSLSPEEFKGRNGHDSGYDRRSSLSPKDFEERYGFTDYVRRNNFCNPAFEDCYLRRSECNPLTEENCGFPDKREIPLHYGPGTLRKVCDPFQEKCSGIRGGFRFEEDPIYIDGRNRYGPEIPARYRNVEKNDEKSGSKKPEKEPEQKPQAHYHEEMKDSDKRDKGRHHEEHHTDPEHHEKSVEFEKTEKKVSGVNNRKGRFFWPLTSLYDWLFYPAEPYGPYYHYDYPNPPPYY